MVFRVLFPFPGCNRLHRSDLTDLRTNARELLTGDPDLNPEGFGQVSARPKAGIWTATSSFMLENWRYQDAILNSSAFAVGVTNAGLRGNPTSTPPTSSVGPIPVPAEGQGCNNPSSGGVSLNVPTSVGCVFALNGMTNATWVDFTPRSGTFSRSTCTQISS